MAKGNKFDKGLEDLMEEADSAGMNEREKKMLAKMKAKGDREYKAGLTKSLEMALMLEDEENKGVSNHDVIAVKMIDHIKNESTDIVKDVETLHRIVDGTKSKVDVQVGGIEEYLKAITGDDKF